MRATAMVPVLVLWFAATVANADEAALRAAMLTRVNAYRAEQHLPAVRENAKLDAAAAAHAADMAGRGALDHTGADGSTAAERVKLQNYAFAQVGENIAYGAKTAAETVDLWMKSPAHHHILLLPDVRDAGVGHAQSPDPDVPSRLRDWWTLVLAAPGQRSPSGDGRPQRCVADCGGANRRQRRDRVGSRPSRPAARS
ncbi:MAG TPA: CAP domain-containing protein [Candidatus Cybelea sp.]|nr:CAP domain-containing protein [Candidatus Cybelea sp.]